MRSASVSACAMLRVWSLAPYLLLFTTSVSYSVFDLPSASAFEGNLFPDEIPYKLSSEAQRCKELIDAGKYEACQRLIDKMLESNRKDAGLYVQYARLIILMTDPAYPNFMQSPLIPGNEFYWAQGIAADASKIAAGLDPEIKPYVTDEILRAFATRLLEAIEEGRGFVGHGRMLFSVSEGKLKNYRGISLSMVETMFQVVSLSTDSAARWIKAYSQINTKLVSMGKVASAMMMGNLIGEMSQNPTQTSDFVLANRSFLDASKNYSPDPDYDWVREVAEAYPLCFRSELLEIQNGSTIDPRYQDVISVFKKFRVRPPKASDELPKNLAAPTGMGPG